MAEDRALNARLEAVEARLANLSPRRTPPTFADPRFPEQSAFINDTAHLSTLLCTRRAGKSLGVGRKLLKTAYEKPGSSCLYIALTRDSAKKIMWKDVLKPLNRQLELGAKANETDLTMTLPNGSVVYLLGVDTDEEQKQKLLGQRYAGVAIDEAASFTIDLGELVYRVVDPATVDLGGWVALTGTPGNLKRGLFFDLTRGQDPQDAGRWTVTHEDKRNGAGVWSGHRWDTMRNPYMAEKWKAKIDGLKAASPRIVETPGFRQEFLGQWVIDDSKLVYRYQPGRNDFNGELPVIRRGRWWHVIGVDLGYEDATAFGVGAYHDHSRELFILEAWKRTKMDVTDVANEIKRLSAKYEPDRTVIDGANKQAVEEMRKRHNIQLKAADKTGKADFIEIMNAEFIQARIKLSPDCQAAKDEYAGLIWDDRSDKKVEHPNCENHVLDALLYMWREAFSYLGETILDEPAPGSAEYQQKQADEMRSDALRQLEHQREATRDVFDSSVDVGAWDSWNDT